MDADALSSHAGQVSRRRRAFIAAATPFALVFVFSFLGPVSHSQVTSTWSVWSLPFERTGNVFAGLAVASVGWDGFHSLIFPVVGWIVVAAWCCAVRFSRVGDFRWGTHAAISSLWVILSIYILARAVFGT